MCFLQSGFVSLERCLFSPSDTDAQSRHCRQCVAMVTPALPRLRHPGWFQKVNVAEWFSKVWFFSIHRHLARARQPFWCLFSPDWLTEPLHTPPAPLILAGAWLNRTSLPWRLRRWHSRAQTRSHRLGNESGWLSSLTRRKVVAPKERQQRGLSCHLNERLCENGWRFLSHFVKCKPSLWIIPN